MWMDDAMEVAVVMEVRSAQPFSWPFDTAHMGLSAVGSGREGLCM